DNGLENALCQLGRNSFASIEDIDAQGGPVARQGEKKEGSVGRAIKKGNDEFEPLFGLTLSGLLNAIDGISGSDGRILIMTTNHPEKLDHALLRPGRIDVRIKIGYLCRETFEKFFKRFYPHYRLPENISFKEDITPAKFQGLVLENRNNPEKVLEKVVDKVS
ncbi:AAA family ATPase, partial [Nocardia mangyaensis]|uniref:AAA family ATPase n=1 Tax=Nocardia mangyaensis TaxID=2213200 RepID=UPI0026753624